MILFYEKQLINACFIPKWLIENGFAIILSNSKYFLNSPASLKGTSR